MKLALALILIFVFSLCSSAQTTFEISTWRLQDPEDFALTSDGGYLIGGSMLDTASGLNDVFALVKIDSLGNEQWASMFSDNGHDSYITSLFQASDGNYVFTGRPDGLFTDKAFLAMVDSTGNNFWTGGFALPGFHSFIPPPHCIEANDHNYALVFHQGNGSIAYTSLVKINPLGTILWERNYSDTINFLLQCNSISATNDNGFILTGSSYWGCFLLRVDSSGNPLWYKIFNTQYQVPGTCVKQTDDNGFIVTCSNRSTTGGQAIVIRTDPAGDTLWTRTISGPEDHCLFSVVETSDSNFVFTGAAGNPNTNSQKFFLIKIDQAGDTLWTRTYGNSTVNVAGVNIKLAPDNSLISLCMPFISTSLIKTDANGMIGCGLSNSVTVIEKHPTPLINGFLTTIDSSEVTPSGWLFQQFYPPSTSVSCYSVGIETPAESGEIVSVYPNPSTNHLHIECKSPLQESKVFGMEGKLLLVEKEKRDIELTGIDAGIYFLQVKTEAGIISRKFVKE